MMQRPTTMTNLDKLPPISAVYHVIHKGNVVYVGQTKNLKLRWKNHHILATLFKLYGDSWHIEWVKISQGNLDRAEAFAYRQFQPTLNQQNPSCRLGNL